MIAFPGGPAPPACCPTWWPGAPGARCSWRSAAQRSPVPSRALADADRCPDTGRRRLSYERAEYLFKQATRSLDPDGHGYTLRRLRDCPPVRLPAGA
jgi:hypothetical protein